MGSGGQVGAVRLQHDIFEGHVPHGLGQRALPEGHHPADAEPEIAQRPQPAIGRLVLAESVEHAPQAAPAEFADHPLHLRPGIPRVDGNRQIALQRQPALSAERLDLLVAERCGPVEIQTDLAHPDETDSGRRVFQQSRRLVQLLAPTGIVVQRRRVQTHHRQAAVAVTPAGIQHPAVGRRVDGRKKEPFDPRGTSAGDRFVAVGIELGFVDMGMGVYEFHRLVFTYRFPGCL